MLKALVNLLLSGVFLMSSLLYFFPYLATGLSIPTFTIFLVNGFLLIVVLSWDNNGTLALMVLAGVLIVVIDYFEFLTTPDWAKGLVLLFSLILTVLGVLEVINTALKKRS